MKCKRTRQLNEIRKVMHEQNGSLIKKQKHKKGSNRTNKSNRELQKQLDQAEERIRIRELKNRSFEIMQLEEQKEKRIKKPMWIIGHYEMNEHLHFGRPRKKSERKFILRNNS